MLWHWQSQTSSCVVSELSEEVHQIFDALSVRVEHRRHDLIHYGGRRKGRSGDRHVEFGRLASLLVRLRPWDGQCSSGALRERIRPNPMAGSGTNGSHRVKLLETAAVKDWCGSVRPSRTKEGQPPTWLQRGCARVKTPKGQGRH